MRVSSFEQYFPNAPTRTGGGKAGTALAWAAGAAGALAAATIFNKFAAGRAETRYPPPGRMLDVDGVAVHVIDTGVVEGDGAPTTIVLLHGNASLVQDFMVSGIVDRLCQRHRVILFDRPGYGYTERPDDREWTAEAQADLFVKACDQLGVANPVVLGHSWGTLVATAWAIHHPGRVHSLVLLSGYYYASARVDSAMLKATRLPVLKQLFANAIAPLQTRLTGPAGIKMVFSPAETPDRFMADMPFELMLRPGQLAASALDGAQMPANAARLAQRYSEIRVPVAMAWGAGDKLVDQEAQSAKMARDIAAASAREMPGLGHMIHHSDPDAIVALVETVAG